MDKDEVLKTVQVDPEKIVCRTCKYKNGGMGALKGKPHFTKSVCEMYTYPKSKPSSVLFENADCMFYERDIDF